MVDEQRHRRAAPHSVLAQQTEVLIFEQVSSLMYVLNSSHGHYFGEKH
jgi:hypothetical protein